MPSGAKKRKAAKRKQKQQQQLASINSDSTSDPHPRGNGTIPLHRPAGRNCESRDRNPLSTDEEPEAGKKENILENGKEEPVDNGAEQTPPGLQVESVQPTEVALKETGLEKLGSEASAVIHVLHPDLANENVIPVREAITETSEAAVHDPNNAAEAENLPTATELLPGTENTETPAAAVSIEPRRLETCETAVSTEPRKTEAPETALTTEPTRAGTPETAATAEKDVPTSLMHHRTRWWNCCGLFDVISG